MKMIVWALLLMISAAAAAPEAFACGMSKSGSHAEGEGTEVSSEA
jgi:hypothetical protein